MSRVSDFLDKLLNSRKKRNAFKAGKSKAKLHTFNLSDDDEDKLSRPKKVSFLKSKRNSSEDKAASELLENQPPEFSVDGHDNNNGSFSSQHSTKVSEDNTQDETRSVEPTGAQLTEKTSSQSYQTSDDTLPLPPLSDGSIASRPEEQKNSVLGETFEVPPTSPLDNTTSAGLGFILHYIFKISYSCTNIILITALCCFFPRERAPYTQTSTKDSQIKTMCYRNTSRRNCISGFELAPDVSCVGLPAD